jgi:hypothetical protein
MFIQRGVGFRRVTMKIFGIVCVVIAAMVIIIWLFRKAVIAGKYTRTVGEIINFKNMVPLVNKTMINHKGKYLHTQCQYKGDVFVVVRFVDRNGQEMTRRFNASDPFILNINEQERTVQQYTAVYPEWQIGKRVKVYYDPDNTTDIFVGKAPSFRQQ